MRIFRDLIPTTENTAVALGYFDGVHLGHKKVIELAVKCKNEGLTPVVFTFNKTPKKGDGLLQLLTVQQRAEKLEELGIEILYIVDFNMVKEFTPEEFIEKIVKNIFNAKKVFCGFNYHFGKNGAGDSQALQKLCGKYNIHTEVADAVIVDDETISSTRIRKLLQKGDIRKANELLGYDFGYKSQAVKGRRIGSQMGTPTINQQISEGVILPEFGVYASIVTFDEERYIGVTNIGLWWGILTKIMSLLAPFIVAFAFAYAFTPLVRFLDKKMPRVLALTIVIGGILLIIFGILAITLPLIYDQLALLIKMVI